MNVRCPLCGTEVERFQGLIPFHFEPRRKGERGLRGCAGPDGAEVPHYPSTTTTFGGTTT